jgi:hypothetical protein
MGYASHKIGYDGYAASADVIVSDATVYNSFGGGGYTTKITGTILSDLSEVSDLRFKVTLKHDQLTHNIEVRVYIGGDEIWYYKHIAADVNWHTYEIDIPVTWHRGDILQVKNQASANTGSMKDFQICGKISPVRLD